MCLKVHRSTQTYFFSTKCVLPIQFVLVKPNGNSFNILAFRTFTKMSTSSVPYFFIKHNYIFSIKSLKSSSFDGIATISKCHQTFIFCQDCWIHRPVNFSDIVTKKWNFSCITNFLSIINKRYTSHCYRLPIFSTV